MMIYFDFSLGALVTRKVPSHRCEKVKMVKIPGFFKWILKVNNPGLC